MRTVFDALRREAVIGSLRVPIADAGPNGELQIGGEEGTVLRPISFGQRTRAVAHAALTPDPKATIAAGVLQAATVRPGSGDALLLEVIALALAGADYAAPPFVATALLLAREAGWVYAEIAEADAVEIDRIAIVLAQRPNDGWKRVMLVRDTADELTAIRAEYTENLLQRVDGAQMVAGAPEEATADRHLSPGHPAGMMRPPAGVRDEAPGPESPPALNHPENQPVLRSAPDTPQTPAVRPAFTFRARLAHPDQAAKLPRTQNASDSPVAALTHEGRRDPQRAGPPTDPAFHFASAPRPADRAPSTNASAARHIPPARATRHSVTRPGPQVESVAGSSPQAGSVTKSSPQVESVTKSLPQAGSVTRSSPQVESVTQSTQTGANTRGRLSTLREATAVFSATAALSTVTVAEDMIGGAPDDPVRGTAGMSPLADADEIADLLAVLLAEEADLRGLDR